MNFAEELIIERSKLARDIIMTCINSGAKTQKDAGDLMKRGLAIYDEEFFK